jgi:DNA-binding transcriptional LysR family regulator
LAPVAPAVIDPQSKRGETSILDTSFAGAYNCIVDSFSGLEAFARVVEAGSFTGAAARLQTAKSSVSDTVRALEERLGVRLLERTTRRVHPTEAGRLLYARCQRLLDEATAARAEARAMRSAPSGAIRVAVPDSFGERLIVPGLGHFLAKFPAIRVELASTRASSRRSSIWRYVSLRRLSRRWSCAASASQEW